MIELISLEKTFKISESNNFGFSLSYERNK